mgnify:CR=1 FL=1
MEPSALIAVAGGLTAATGVLGVRFGPRLHRAWRVRRLADPGFDPALRHLSPPIRDRWTRAWDTPHPPTTMREARTLVATESVACEAGPAIAALREADDRAGLVALGLTLGHVDGHPWRAALRTLPDLDPTDADALAIEAERRFALGEHDRARELLDALPPDHWRACRVRGCLYALAGDPERSASAHHAAWALAPDATKPALARRQGAGWSVR